MKRMYLFSLIATIIIVWKFLLPGYVLIVDSTVGPHLTFPTIGGSVFSNYLSFVLMYILSNVFGAMFAQKIYIFSLFFCLFYFPLRFLPFKVSEPNKYLASILFVVNPFVYERFLVGQFGVLFGYAFLFPFIYFLVKFLREYDLKDFQKTLVSVFLIGVFSFHFFVMSCLILIGAILFSYNKIDSKQKNNLAVSVVVFLIVNLYWLLPYMLQKVDIVETFSENHELAFAT
jgi:hypothetical protein